MQDHLCGMHGHGSDEFAICFPPARTDQALRVVGIGGKNNVIKRLRLGRLAGDHPHLITLLVDTADRVS